MHVRGVLSFSGDIGISLVVMNSFSARQFAADQDLHDFVLLMGPAAAFQMKDLMK